MYLIIALTSHESASILDHIALTRLMLCLLQVRQTSPLSAVIQYEWFSALCSSRAILYLRMGASQ
jgi:hypothetical protein